MSAAPAPREQVTRQKDLLVVRWAKEMPADFQRRVLSRIDRSGECHTWPVTKNGRYGTVAVPLALGVKMASNRGGPTVPVHRAVYVASVSYPLASREVIDHLCRNKLCARIEHLEAVTHRVNVLRGAGVTADYAQRTQCPKGHDLDDPASRRRGTEWRICATCHREEARRQTSALKAAREVLGLTHRAYITAYGWSRVTAEEILASRMVTS